MGPLFFWNDSWLLRYSIMVIVNPTTTSHSVKLTPREFTGDLSLVLRDDFTKETYEVEVTTTTTGRFTTAEFDYLFKEGKWYAYTLKDSANIPVSRGKIFATEQTELEKYDILKDVYDEELGYDNKFMTI